MTAPTRDDEPLGAHALHIRDARPDEHDAIAALTLAAYAEYASIMTPTAWAGLADALRSALAREGTERVVAEMGGAVVGSVMLFPPEADAYGGIVGDERPTDGAGPEIRLLAVSRDGRQRGVGEALVSECVRRARAQGASEVGLHTSRSMRAAMRLYGRLGFVRAPERDFEPEGGEIVEGYRLPLHDAPEAR
jgi:predicted N-acetyltransferase YhbS